MNMRFDNVFILGDIHGNFRPAQRLYHWLHEKQEQSNALILLGDTGLNVDPLAGRRLKEQLATLPFTYFVIRGNHDRRIPKSFKKETFWDGPVSVEEGFERIKYASDEVEVYSIPAPDKSTIKTLVIPGAYSVDKLFRISQFSFWYKDEQLSPEEMECGLELCKKINYTTDLILSHTCPKSLMPTDLFLQSIDQSTVDQSMEEYLDRVRKLMYYKLWCWGHFHDTRVYEKDEYDSQHILLNYEAAIELFEWISGKGETLY